MKVLLITHHREDSGWGRACRDFIKALSTQVDVVARPVMLGGNYQDKDIVKLENKSLDGVTHCIQYLLPHFISYKRGFDKIVGISLLETYGLKSTKILHQLGLVDEVWDLRNHPIATLKDLRIRNTSQAFEYDENTKKINVPSMNGTYKFYCIAECIKRKNIQGIIRSFLSEFEYEPVSLLLKTSIPNMSPAESYREVQNIINQIKGGCRMYVKDSYPEIHVITDRLDEDGIKAIHDYCDCYIDFSYGESINYGLLEAGYFGNDIISTVYNYYAKKLNLNKLCRVTIEPCYGQVYTFPGYNTSREYWDSPVIVDLMLHMRESYNKKEKFTYNIDQFSYKNMGQEYLELLVS